MAKQLGYAAARLETAARAAAADARCGSRTAARRSGRRLVGRSVRLVQDGRGFIERAAKENELVQVRRCFGARTLSPGRRPDTPRSRPCMVVRHGAQLHSQMKDGLQELQTIRQEIRYGSLLSASARLMNHARSTRSRPHRAGWPGAAVLRPARGRRLVSVRRGRRAHERHRRGRHHDATASSCPAGT